MPAYYNELDSKKAAWLRELISRGLIAPGDVDERSIVDVRPDDLRGYTQCHFFAGIGIWSYALRLAGWPDDREVWTGSCPCQPFSAAGKGEAFDDERHLWPDLFRLIEARRPVVCFGEQVASVDGLTWLDTVQSDLDDADYTCGAVDICAAGFGAPHRRQRLYWVADTGGAGLEERRNESETLDKNARPLSELAVLAGWKTPCVPNGGRISGNKQDMGKHQDESESADRAGERGETEPDGGRRMESGDIHGRQCAGSYHSPEK